MPNLFLHNLAHPFAQMAGLKHLQGKTRDWVRELLLDPSQDRGLFNAATLERLLANPGEDLTPLRGSKLWQMAALNLWLNEQGL